MRYSVGLSLILFVICGTVSAGPAHLSDAQIKRLVIQESIAAYPGPCACRTTRHEPEAYAGAGMPTAVLAVMRSSAIPPT